MCQEGERGPPGPPGPLGLQVITDLTSDVLRKKSNRFAEDCNCIKRLRKFSKIVSAKILWPINLMADTDWVF